MSLGINPFRIIDLLTNARFVLVALVANFIIPPIIALLLIRIFSLDEPLAVGLRNPSI